MQRERLTLLMLQVIQSPQDLPNVYNAPGREGAPSTGAFASWLDLGPCAELALGFDFVSALDKSVPAPPESQVDGDHCIQGDSRQACGSSPSLFLLQITIGMGRRLSLKGSKAGAVGRSFSISRAVLPPVT